jgi:hypothetical protein
MTCIGLVIALWFWMRWRGNRSPSVHVVLAMTTHQDSRWTANLKVPNLMIAPYMADNENATFHPVANKGNEAMIYLTYLHDFYNELPDIAIFTHGQDYAWHIDEILEQSTANAINKLDLNEVVRRQYVNLRVSWKNACPTWMNTSIELYSREYDPMLKAEEPLMKGAFQNIFLNTTVPIILAQPCCSQFAVTKEAIRSVPRERYLAAITWLENTPLPSEMSGRIWEHLWQYLFLQRAVDCPDERKTLCSTYHICFETEEDWERWKILEDSIQSTETTKFVSTNSGTAPPPETLLEHDQRLEEIHKEMVSLKQKAIMLGSDVAKRREISREWVGQDLNL